MAKRTGTSKTRADRAAAASETPWVSTPDAPKAPVDDAKKATRTTSTPITSSQQGQTSSPWTDTFEYSPWVSGSSTAGRPTHAAATATATRARIQAQQIRASADQLSGYENPWNDAGPGADTGPLSRRDAIRARAAAKRRANIQAKAGDLDYGTIEEDDYEDLEDEAVEESSRPQREARKQTKPKGAEASSTVWALGPQEIPVENLPMGVVNIIGDSVGAVVETGKSAGSSLNSALKTTLKTTPAIASVGMVGVAGTGLLLGYASSITMAWKII